MREYIVEVSYSDQPVFTVENGTPTGGVYGPFAHYQDAVKAVHVLCGRVNVESAEITEIVTEDSVELPTYKDQFFYVWRQRGLTDEEIEIKWGEYCERN